MSTLSRVVLAGALSTALASHCFAEGPTSSGTGFAVTGDGWLMTNAHVVQGCERIEVKGKGDASDPRIDATNDLALVKVQSNAPLKPVVFRQAPTRLGEDIVAVGYPLASLLADSVKVTTGNVNALAGLRNDTRYIQISTPIQPGNSGGPIVDRDGFLLGITSATFSKQAADEIGITAQNVNFAIRASVADLFMQSQSIVGQSGDRAADQKTISTADLSEKVTPSVFQILCYGKPEERASNMPSEAATNLPTPTVPSALIDARGYDAIGFDYRTVKDVTFAGCHEICESDRRCKAITYNTKYGVCFLKDNVVALIRNGDAVAAYSSVKAADVIMSDFTSYSGMDLPGGDYKRLRESNYLQCFTACIGDNSCKAFSYVPKKSECWLKDALGRPKATKGVELGVK
ncbi:MULTISPECIES: trypsin-like peptidase domain-containing protein [Rhizobium]|uniref:trypsin-like peptidase domain-containing protein n=1 Tax=Rhizobium TaxID=379 RepID=UPI00234FA52C|nr:MULTISPECIES: trypsin-like peptidase domain-containing protein [unclassified Rhizobium]MDC7742359.1 trypsin-like peptidase domain-containing protein [Rhizobium sp. BC56]MDC9813296.1 trypsin-like peptidase domain-containing protein [Rhizobium sp. MC62]MDC9837015.1 trypsin-like peptidase domain-containing protein [Rhizobium sp. MJ37]WEA27523.1 trypsin-like peptidase domain-containing protein [Rhizobium sp. MJ22]WEA61991.1 trypsin-like peptidase domain-containing protein [Rhizobium sp. BJ04]